VTIAAPGVVVSRPVVVAPPVVTPVAYGYGTPGVYYRNDYDRRESFDRDRRESLNRDRRESLERMRREQREAAMRRAAWLHQHGHRW
jgi:hypothetical protein